MGLSLGPSYHTSPYSRDQGVRVGTMPVLSVIILIYTFRNEGNEPRVGLGAHRTLCKPYYNHLITMAFVSPGSHVHSELIPITLKIWASLLP